jgi:hypothetical protein
MCKPCRTVANCNVLISLWQARNSAFSFVEASAVECLLPLSSASFVTSAANQKPTHCIRQNSELYFFFLLSSVGLCIDCRTPIGGVLEQNTEENIGTKWWRSESRAMETVCRGRSWNLDIVKFVTMDLSLMRWASNKGGGGEAGGIAENK